MVEWNFVLLGFLVLSLIHSGTQFYLNRLNVSYLRRHRTAVPAPFKEIVDEEKLRKISAYTSDSTYLDLISGLTSQAWTLAILLSGFLPWLVDKVGATRLGTVGEGLLFFAILSGLGSLLHLPFGAYETFVIEARYGFNTKTFRLWVVDLLKGIAIVGALGGLLLCLLLNLVVHGGLTWWLWAWMLVGGYELLMLWLFPVVIAPWFNTFEPVGNASLKERVENLMEKVGLRARGVFRMDASRRSRHTNAYFTGFGRSKRIVLYDTLLVSHTEEEILAVLGHEIGHWKKKHVLKQVIVLEILSLGIFYVIAQGLKWPLLYQTFGFERPVVYVGLFLLSTLLSPLGYLVQPLESAILRAFEREADDFTLSLMETAEPIQGALKRLAADNLANLTPHPLYAWFYYSHPPLVERISRLQNTPARDKSLDR